jgi:hypothetical protein
MRLVRHKLMQDVNAEEGASIRGVRRVYAQRAGPRFEDTPEPKALYEIAEAARKVTATRRERRFVVWARFRGMPLRWRVR